MGVRSILVIAKEEGCNLASRGPARDCTLFYLRIYSCFLVNSVHKFPKSISFAPLFDRSNLGLDVIGPLADVITDARSFEQVIGHFPSQIFVGFALALADVTNIIFDHLDQHEGFANL